VPELLNFCTTDGARATSPEGLVEVVFPSDHAIARQLQEEIVRALVMHHFEEKEIFSIKLALEEALVNAIKHGNQADRNKKVHVAYRVNAERFDIHVRDEGPGFDPEDVPDPLAVENLERPCGRGLLLMRHYMTEVNFHPPGNRLSMSKVRSKNCHRNGHA